LKKTWKVLVPETGEVIVVVVEAFRFRSAAETEV